MMAGVKPKKELPLLTPKPGSELTALSWAVSADPNLSPEARSKLLELDRVLAGRKLKGTLTSGRRKPDGTRSDHHHGNAIDLVTPGDMAALASELKALGYRAQFERKGQKNPNGSVATGDHLHVTLLPDAKPKPDPFFAAFERAGRSKSADPFFAAFERAGKPSVSAARPTADPFFAAFERAGAVPKSPAGGGKGEVADLMGSLLRGDHLGGKPAPATRPTPAKAKPAAPREPTWLEKFGSLSNAYNAWLNELAWQGKMIPNVTKDPAGHFRALPTALKTAFAEAVRHYGPEAVQPEHFRIGLGLERGKAGRAEYNTAAVLDYLTSFGTDPTGIVMGPAGKLAGKALGAGGRVVTGAAGAAASKAAVPVGRAVGTGLAVAENALSKTGAGRMIVTGAKAGTKAASGAASVATEAAGYLGKPARYLTGALRASLLRRPSSAFTNAVVNPIVQSADELARHNLPAASLALHIKPAVTGLATYKKTGQATGAVAELLQHAPGILDEPAALAGQHAAKGGLLRKIWDAPLTAMGAGDSIGKVALYRALRAGGLGAPEAAARVKVAMFDYGGLNKALRAADQHGLLLFGSFLGASTKSFAQQLATRPDLVNRYPRLQQQLFNEFPGSREDFDKLPSYQRTPFTYPIGNGRFLDLQRFHQWTTQLGLLQDALKNGGPALKPPTLGDVVGKTTAGPLVGAVVTEKRATAPDGTSLPAGWRDLLHRVFPVAKDLNRVMAAYRQIPLSDRKTDEAQSLLHAAAQAGLGASVVRAETRGEQANRTAPAVNARGRAADQLVSALDKGLRVGVLKNPYAAEANRLVNFDEARREFQAADRHLREMMLSPRNFTPQGRLALTGQERIRNAFLRKQALGARLDELGARQRGGQ